MEQPTYRSASLLWLFSLLVCLPYIAHAADTISKTLIGTWKGKCIDIGATPDGRYIVSIATYKQGNQYHDQTLYYKDANCKTRSSGIKKNKGTFKIGKEVKMADGKNAYQIDYIITSNYYKTFRLPSIRIKNIIHIEKNTMTMGKLTPSTLKKRPGALDPSNPATRQ